MLKAPRIIIKAPRMMAKAPRIMPKAPRIMLKAPNKMSFDHLRQLWPSIRPPRLKNFLKLNYSSRKSSLQTDRHKSRSRQYIDRAKDWVEWTLEKPPRVKNRVLPRCARQQQRFIYIYYGHPRQNNIALVAEYL
jgi:hypothetical protein